jgi:hypothetical protein
MPIMKTNYSYSICHHWFVLLWIMLLPVTLKAQLTAPPVIQWQQLLVGGIDFNSIPKLATGRNGDFGLLNGNKALFTLTQSGNIVSGAAVEGSVLVNTNPVEYSNVVRVAGLAPTDDGNFLVLANDETNLYLIKKDRLSNRIWSSIVAPANSGSETGQYYGVELLKTIDGNYMVFAGHSVTGYSTTIAAIKVTPDGVVLWNRDIFEKQLSNVGNLVLGGFNRVVGLPDGSFVLSGGQFSPFRRPQPNQGVTAKIDGEAKPIWRRTYDQIVNVSDLIPNPYQQGTCLLLGSIDPFFNGNVNGATFPYRLEVDGSLTKLGSYQANGLCRIASDGSGQPYYVILEPTSQNGGDFKLTGLNQLHEPVWTKTIGGSLSDNPQAIITTEDGYLLAGNTNSTDGDVKNNPGIALATWVVKLSKTATPLIMSQPTYNCLTGAITFHVTGGDGSPIVYTAPGVTRSSLTDNFGVVEQGLRNDPKPITIQATQSGTTVSYTFDFRSVCYTINDQLGLYLGTYNCQTGAITFYTIGGDGSPIQFSTPGISRPSPASMSGIIEQELRNDPKPITILATQNGKTISLTFDFAAYCTSQQPPTSGPLQLVAPGYDCSTGAIHFNTSGGNGSAIEFQAAGITGWTTNPNQFVDQESRTANDVKPFLFMARQSGQVVTYSWDLKASCGRARMGVSEAHDRLQVKVLGNPIEGKTAEVEISGVSGESVEVELVDLQGRQLHQHNIREASPMERVSIPISNKGMLLLNIRTTTERQQVKLLKLY